MELRLSRRDVLGRAAGGGALLAFGTLLAPCGGSAGQESAAPQTASVAAPAAPTAASAAPAAASAASARASTTSAAASPAAASSSALATSSSASAAAAQATACNGKTTLEETEGPYFKAGSPENANLIKQGLPGTVLNINGYVMDKNCKPVSHALLDFWQADNSDSYDNSGYTLRGHLFTDAAGRYQVQTIVPCLYPGRTRHIHVKVQAPNRPVLTTQLFFPNEPRNASDSIFDKSLVLPIATAGSAEAATFNFTVA